MTKRTKRTMAKHRMTKHRTTKDRTCVLRHGMLLRDDRPGLAKVWPSIPTAADSTTVCTVTLEDREAPEQAVHAESA